MQRSARSGFARSTISGARLAEPVRLTEIDETNVGDHSYLSADDSCYFLFEYTSHRGYSFSATNNLISNLKKKPSESNRPGYHYKGQAIAQCAVHLRGAIHPDWLATATLVPAPPSKAIGHPDYDDRVERICRLVSGNIDVRSIVQQINSTTAAHELGQGQRPRIDDLVQNYRIAENLTLPAPTAIAIVDDVLTNGTHFKAMHRVLSARYPQVPISGIFIARRVFPEDENSFGEL